MGRGRTILATGLAALLLASTATPAAAATEPSMTVTLAADGSADVTVVSTYDLDSDAERQAFDDLRTNETLQRTYTERFGDRWRAVANSTAAATGREVAVTDVSMSLSRDGSTGVATVTANWDGLAARSDGQLALSEPFASGFTADRRLVVVLPDGYDATSASPEPDESADGRLVYEAGTDLDGFEIAAERAADAETGTTGGSGPGFGVVAALAALAAAGVLARVRG